MRNIIGKNILFDNRTDDGKRKFYGQIKDLPPDEYIILIKKNKPKHSIKQSNFFHAICQLYAIQTGHYLEEIKDEFKRDRFFEMKVDKQGREFKRLKPTADLDEAEYSVLNTLLLEWGKEKHPEVVVPKKGDLTYIQWMNIGNEYTRTFSGY